LLRSAPSNVVMEFSPFTKGFIKPVSTLPQ